MPSIRVRDKRTGKTNTIQWDKPEPPTPDEIKSVLAGTYQPFKGQELTGVKSGYAPTVPEPESDDKDGFWKSALAVPSQMVYGGGEWVRNRYEDVMGPTEWTDIAPWSSEAGQKSKSLYTKPETQEAMRSGEGWAGTAGTVAGNIAMFANPGAKINAATKGMSALARYGAEAGLGGLIGGMQSAGDPYETAKGAAFGAGGAAVANKVAKYASPYVKRFFAEADEVVPDRPPVTYNDPDYQTTKIAPGENSWDDTIGQRPAPKPRSVFEPEPPPTVRYNDPDTRTTRIPTDYDDLNFSTLNDAGPPASPAVKFNSLDEPLTHQIPDIYETGPLAGAAPEASAFTPPAPQAPRQLPASTLFGQARFLGAERGAPIDATAPLPRGAVSEVLAGSGQTEAARRVAQGSRPVRGPRGQFRKGAPGEALSLPVNENDPRFLDMPPEAQVPYLDHLGRDMPAPVTGTIPGGLPDTDYLAVLRARAAARGTIPGAASRRITSPAPTTEYVGRPDYQGPVQRAAGTAEAPPPAAPDVPEPELPGFVRPGQNIRELPDYPMTQGPEPPPRTERPSYLDEPESPMAMSRGDLPTVPSPDGPVVPPIMNALPDEASTAVRVGDQSLLDQADDWDRTARNAAQNEGRNINDVQTPLTPVQQQIKASADRISEHQAQFARWFSQQEEMLPKGQFFDPPPGVEEAYRAEQAALKDAHQKLVQRLTGGPEPGRLPDIEVPQSTPEPTVPSPDAPPLPRKPWNKLFDESSGRRPLGEEGSVSGTLGRHIGAGATGGIFGGLHGETSEERWKNAAIGAGLGVALSAAPGIRRGRTSTPEPPKLKRAKFTPFTEAGRGRIKEEAIDALNVPRSIMASADFSAPLRQGATMIHRKEYWKAWAPMFKSAFSEESFKDLQAEIASRSSFQRMRDSGLRLSDLSEKAVESSQREELYMSRLAEKIPGFGRVIRGSGRAYVGFLNKLRADTFDSLTQSMQAAHGSTGLSDDATKSISKYINDATGAGDWKGILKKNEGAMPLLNAVAFSPRLMASRVNMLGIGTIEAGKFVMNPVKYMNAPPSARKEYLKSMAGFGTAALSILGLAKQAGAEVEDDPRSSDFGKIKIGNVRMDIGGGFQQYLRAGAQFAMGQRKDLRTGRIRDLKGKRPGETRWDIATNFAESKASPLMGLFMDWSRGKNFMGEDVKLLPEGNPLKGEWSSASYLKSELGRKLTPMIAQDYYDLVEENPELRWMIAPSAFGAAVQVHRRRAVPGRY